MENQITEHSQMGVKTKSIATILKEMSVGETVTFTNDKYSAVNGAKTRVQIENNVILKSHFDRETRTMYVTRIA